MTAITQNEQRRTGRMKVHVVRGGGGLRLHVREWGRPDGPPILLRHKDCGEIAETYVACRHCGGEIATDRVTPEPGAAYVSEVDG